MGHGTRLHKNRVHDNRTRNDNRVSFPYLRTSLDSPATILNCHRCREVTHFTPVPERTIRVIHKEFFDAKDPRVRRRVDIKKFPLVDENDMEVPVYDENGKKVQRRKAIADDKTCGVLIDLANIQALFTPANNYSIDDDDTDGPSEHENHHVNVNAYPLGFLGIAGNIQANGIPHAFYPILTKINKNAGRRSNDQPATSDDEDSSMADINQQHPTSVKVVKPVASQFYNHITHRIATRAGRLDSQQGSLTAALSGAFAQSKRDRMTAVEIQDYCNQSQPSDRFHTRTNIRECPTSCRAELVYSVDVRSLKEQSRMYALHNATPILLTPV